MTLWTDDSAELESLRSEFHKRGILLGRTLRTVCYWLLDGRVYCDLATAQLQCSGTLLEFIECASLGRVEFDPTDAWNALTLQGA